MMTDCQVWQDIELLLKDEFTFDGQICHDILLGCNPGTEYLSIGV
jgi:hypothetical protein